MIRGAGLVATRALPSAGGYASAGLWRPETLDEPIRRVAAADPTRSAIVDRDRRFTYGELWQRIQAAAGVLSERGVGPGDVVSFQLPNWAETAIVHHAIVLLGAVSNPITTIYRAHELRFILGQARSKVLIVPDVFRRFDFRDMAAGLMPGDWLEHILVVGDPAPGMESFSAALETAAPAIPPARDAEDVVLLLYTSGTEANPKGVLHSHATLAYECRSIIELYGLTEADRVFMPSPLTHITGLLYGVLMPFMLGTSVVFQDIWDPAVAVDLIETEGCTATVGATPFLHGIVTAERPAESMRLFVCGGADVPPGLIYEADRRLGMRASRVYGSTECPTVTGTPMEAPGERHAESDGAPIGATELRIVGGGDTPLEAGSGGEIQARGPDLCLGYLDPDLNRRGFTDDGWFRTGDLAVADRDGYIQITGRAKDVIVRGGENLSAKEIEDLLFTHPEIEEVAVVGYPDEVMGERACAVVVSEQELTLEDLVSYLRSHAVANQKLPERLKQVDALPRTSSGKVQKYQLRNALRSETER